MNNEMMGLDTSTPNVSSDTESGEMHTVKVDGEEMQVSVDELRNGYQRQADYTRKTQELAAERERLSQGEAIVQALESDPRSAVSALADAFGIGMDNQSSSSPEELEDLDPDEVRLRRIESSIEEQDRALRQTNLQKEMNGLKEKYQTDIDESVLYSHALKHNIGNLDAAFAHMTYDQKSATVSKENENSAIVDEKRAAAVIEPGSGSTENTISKSFATSVSSIRDAYQQAKQDLTTN
jgi:hypothetical protein